MTEPATLDPDRIRDAVSGALIGRKVLVFRETGSTNDVVHRLAQSGEPEGAVVFAETQSAGRGQFGRKWDSQVGLGLWFSVLLRPQWPSHEIGELTPLVAVAVAETVRAFAGLDATVKPPNDIYVGRQKVAGILSEARSGRDSYAVVGIGINVNHASSDFPASLDGRAASLAHLAGITLDREMLAARFLINLSSIYTPDAPPTREIKDRYAALSREWECATFSA